MCFLTQDECCIDKLLVHKNPIATTATCRAKLSTLDRIIEDELLDKEETYKFINNAFRDGYVQTTGTGIAKILPPVSRFTTTGERTQKRKTVIEKRKAFFNRFWDISGSK